MAKASGWNGKVRNDSGRGGRDSMMTSDALEGPHVCLRKYLLDHQHHRSAVTPQDACQDVSHNQETIEPTRRNVIYLPQLTKAPYNMSAVCHRHDLLYNNKDQRLPYFNNGRGRKRQDPPQQPGDPEESQETGGASSSTDPFAIAPDANQQQIVTNLEALLHALLEKSFLQPRENVTTLAYTACSRVHMLRQSLTTGTHSGSTLPETTQGMHLNPLADAQLLLRQMLQNFDSMPLREQRRTSHRVQDIMDQVKQVLRSPGDGPQETNQAQALAGLKNAAAQASFLDLAIEERGLATIREALEALLATVDRTANYLDQHLTMENHDARMPERGPGVPLHHDPARERLPETAQGEVATQVAKAHSLLFAWTAALWGSPIFLVDNAAAEIAEMPLAQEAGDIPLENVTDPREPRLTGGEGCMLTSTGPLTTRTEPLTTNMLAEETDHRGDIT
ncbi:unnamed protein product [Symbiodinium sp. CCMP2592]|nr:unnamed protein product [Symbiodinium sp. CCMP2592]